ncbi:MAG: hypothetical protein OXT09_22830 [Myxococcales bacterium]|nr:hypothetical protein [Myxococcales bacterium]
MGGMPYLFEKGQHLSTMDDRYSTASVDQRIEWLNKLQEKDKGRLILPNGDKAPLLTDLGTFGSDLDTVGHINRDWFGFEDLGDGTWKQHALVDNESTGWWINWNGDAHEMYRVGLVAALEASLGIEHRDAPAEYEVSEARRQWPIECFWTCPSPKFEVAMSWRNHVNGGAAWGPGEVVLVVSTPGANGGSPISPWLNKGPWIHKTEDYKEHTANDPLQTQYRRGLWVIGSNYKGEPPKPQKDEAEPPGEGALAPAFLFFNSDSEVLVIRPSLKDGGVLNS